MDYLSCPANLGALLRSRRKSLGLTLDGCAEQAGVSRQTLVSLESGRGNPRLDTLQALAGVLRVRLALSLELEA